MKVDLNLGDTQRILRACRAEGLTKDQTAYVLATALWETAHTMKPVREAYWYSENWRKDSLRYYPYYGRGYVQLTWRENYRFAGRQIGQKRLVDNPDLALMPEYAVPILVKGMKGGWFTGHKLEDHIGEEANFRTARKIVNGMDKADKIAEIAQAYRKALSDRPQHVGLAAATSAAVAGLAGALALLVDNVREYVERILEFLP